MTLDLALDNRTILTDPLDCAIQELDMLFNTTNTELIGKPEYGTNFEQFLWTLTPTTEALADYVRDKISGTYFLSQYVTNVEVYTEPGDQRDIYYVQIIIHTTKDDEETLQKTRRVYMLT